MAGTQHSAALRASANSVVSRLLGLASPIAGHVWQNVLVFLTLMNTVGLNICTQRPKELDRHESLMLVKMLRGESIPAPPVMCAAFRKAHTSPTTLYMFSL